MRALFYPVMGLAALAIVLGVGCLVVLAFGKWRQDRAVRNARWEAYTEAAIDGMTEVGIQLVARWGRHQRVLHRADNPTKVPASDIQALFAARFDAESQADSHNSMRVSAREWPSIRRGTR